MFCISCVDGHCGGGGDGDDDDDGHRNDSGYMHICSFWIHSGLSLHSVRHSTVFRIMNGYFHFFLLHKSIDCTFGLYQVRNETKEKGFLSDIYRSELERFEIICDEKRQMGVTAVVQTAKLVVHAFTHSFVVSS